MSKPIINHEFKFLKCDYCGETIEIDGIYYNEDLVISCNSCYVNRAFKEFDELEHKISKERCIIITLVQEQKFKEETLPAYVVSKGMGKQDILTLAAEAAENLFILAKHAEKIPQESQ